MLKSATEWVYDSLNRRRLGFFWLIGDGWLRLSAMKCSSAMVGLGYWWRKAQIGDGWVSFGLLAMECSSVMVAWVIGDGMIIDDSWLRISATKCSLATVGFLGYRRRKFNYKIGYRLRLKPYLILLTVLHISKI